MVINFLLTPFLVLLQIRKAMESAVKTYKTLEEEIESVRQYLKNEAFRYDGKLSWECILDPEVDTSVIIPNLLIQTFVENAIRHGIFQNPEGGKVDVSINKSKIGVLIMISDNASDYNGAHLVQKHREENLRLLDQYLDLFNKNQPCAVSYQVLDRADSETDRMGTRVLITLKY